MCDFWSGFVHRSGRIFCGDGQNHGGGAPEAYGYKREDCREVEWTAEGRARLTVRTEPGEDRSFWLALVPESLYPTRSALLATVTEGRTEYLRYTFAGGKTLAVQITPGQTAFNSYLDLRGCPIKALPENLKVGGRLYLSGCPIKALPENLKVSGDLDLRGCPIKALPENLKVGGRLYLHGCENLPAWAQQEWRSLRDYKDARRRNGGD